MKDKLEVMTKLLDGQNALDLVAEQNGNHVIQKCIECIKPASKLQPLVQVSHAACDINLHLVQSLCYQQGSEGIAFSLQQHFKYLQGNYHSGWWSPVPASSSGVKLLPITPRLPRKAE